MIKFAASDKYVPHAPANRAAEAADDDIQTTDRNRQLMFQRQRQQQGTGRGPGRADNRYTYSEQADIQEEAAKKKEGESNKLSKKDRFLLWAEAGFFDFFCAVFNLIPLAGGVVAAVFFGIPGSLILFYMLKKKGMLNSSKFKLIFALVVLAKLIPIVNAYPAFSNGLNVILKIDTVQKKLHIGDGAKK